MSDRNCQLLGLRARSADTDGGVKDVKHAKATWKKHHGFGNGFVTSAQNPLAKQAVPLTVTGLCLAKPARSARSAVRQDFRVSGPQQKNMLGPRAKKKPEQTSSWLRNNSL